MNWELHENLCSLRDSYKGPKKTTGDERQDMETHLAWFLREEGALLHPRRTLDQFYYPSLRNTEKRDADQTISKWTGSGLTEGGRDAAAPDSRMIMVDQLWCWVLDNSK